MRRGKRRKRGKANGPGAGDTGLTDSKDFGVGADAWMGDFAADSNDFAGGAAGESGGAVSGVAPTGAERLDYGEMGRVRKQSEGEVLLADAGGEEVPGAGRGELGAAFGSDRA